jgi:predicted phage-related endonuclease
MRTEYAPTAEQLRNLTQGTPEWLTARRGRVTASRCRDIIAKRQNGKPTDKRYNYLMELVTEHITKRCVEHHVTPAMEWGLEQQPFAQAAYEISQDCSVEAVGLIVHPTIELFASSPDGTVGEFGLVEFKCPTDRVHLEYLRDGVIPEDYIPQMDAQMACMPERRWNDFVSFNPNMPYGMQLFIRRLHRDKERIEKLEAGVHAFLDELVQVIKSLTKVRMVGELTPF